MTYYSDHFGFNAVPFSKEIDDDKLWLPPSKKSIVSDLVECVQERKHAVVTGESGAGKTCVTRAVRHALGNQAVRLTYCHNVTLGRRDFYRHLGFVEHRNAVGGEELLVAADGRQAHSDVIGGVVGRERLNRQAVGQPRVERAISAQCEALVELG